MKISVCMASYNGEKYIKEQILSILPQLGENDELIISDDGSKDKTLEIIKSLNSSKIILLKNRFKKGIVGNFENALKNASGDVIFLADQDDVWLPKKVEQTLPWLEKNDLVASDCIVVDNQLEILRESFFYKRKRHKNLLNNLHHNPYMGCCLAFKKSILVYVLPFPMVTPLHDLWIGLSVELNGRVKFLDEKLLYYRRHGFNNSASGEKSNRSLFSKLSYRLLVLMALFYRRTVKKQLEGF